MEINTTINNSNYMYIRDATKKILGDKVKYIIVGNSMTAFNENVSYDDIIKSLKLSIKELKLLQEHLDNIDSIPNDNHDE